MTNTFKAALTRDFLKPDGSLTYEDIGLSHLDQSGIDYEFFPKHEPIVPPSQLEPYDAVISLTPRYTVDSLAGTKRLTAILRCGVGYDFVDVQACTDNDVALFITQGAVNYSVAEAIIGWMLALSHRVFAKDSLLRESRWAERANYMGSELRRKTLGIVGFGGIGSTLVELLKSFRMTEVLVFDPYLDPIRAEAAGVRIVSLDQLMEESDFVSVSCPLNDQTRDLIRAEHLALMKPTAFLINTARGGIVNEKALFDILSQNRIAGAATDVFETEPANGENPLASLSNIILAPHSIAWTDELFEEMGVMACQQLVQLSKGQIPHGLINREVLGKPGFQRKISQLQQNS